MRLEDEPWVTVAQLGRVRGNRGELTAISFSSRPERFAQLKEVYLFGDGSRYEVESAWFHGERLIFKFAGIDSISAAEPLQGAEVRIPRRERPALERGEFYHSDLIGCEVVERANGNSLGHVVEWQDSGGSGLLAVEGGLLIPFARSICVDIDITARRILVDLPAGLKELNRD